MGRERARNGTRTLENVVAEIAGLHRTGRLRLGQGVHRHHPQLVAAACRLAGSWTRALRFAGIDYKPPRQWSRARVAAEIRRRHWRRLSLSATRTPTPLLLAARRHFGGWRAAKRVALPWLADRWRTWDRARVTQALRVLAYAGAPITVARARGVGPPGLVNAAVRLFGSWVAAVEAAIPGHVWGRRHWSVDLVLDALRNRHRSGRSLASHEVVREDLRLVAAARHYFRSWPVALQRAGLPIASKEIWTPRVILSEIAAYLRHDTWPRTAVFPKSMTNKAMKTFGSWYIALAMAGGVPAPA